MDLELISWGSGTRPHLRAIRFHEHPSRDTHDDNFCLLAGERQVPRAMAVGLVLIPIVAAVFVAITVGTISLCTVLYY